MATCEVEWLCAQAIRDSMEQGTLGESKLGDGSGIWHPDDFKGCKYKVHGL